MELPHVEPVFVKAKDIINFKPIKEIDMFDAVSKKIKPDMFLEYNVLDCSGEFTLLIKRVD